MSPNQEPTIEKSPVKLTGEDYARIADMEVGKTMTVEDKDFLAEKGILLDSGAVAVIVDGGEPRLIDTSSADFGTRLRLGNTLDSMKLESPEVARKLGGNALSGEIIDGVPGVVREAQAQSDAIVPNVEFKGDPRRVIGHPSNEANQAIQAYGDSLKNQ